MWVLCPFKTAKSRLVFNLIVQTYEKNVSFILRFDMTKITRFRIIYS